MKKYGFSKINIIGLGYIGLPTAAVFASANVQVHGVDVRPDVVDTINAGGIHIVEPDLDMIVRDTVTRGSLTASVTPCPADAFVIAVPTPFVEESHAADLSYIRAAAKSIAPYLARGNLVVLESTSPIGATDQMAAWLAEERPDLSFPQQAGEAADIMVAHCPERVLPGHVMRELFENDRIIGGMTPRCARRATELYRIFVKGCCIPTNARTAEFAKLAENSYRDTNIAFANELSLICDEVGVDVWELIELANRHPRVNILQPGPGVGGHCIAVDPWFIVSSAPKTARLIRTAREVNDSKPLWVIDQVREAGEALGLIGRKPRVACLGLAFKPDIDDLRESPALDIVRELSGSGTFEVLVSEPNIHALPPALADKAEMMTAEAAIEAADIVLLLVDHRPFKNLAVPLGKPVIDTRGMWRQSRGMWHQTRHAA
ncbi:UDP-N-acetyl-D-mannosamine dehydrogenase [Celeribacter sp. SCSIO 80788]|uniref:UDP-N-acetyl-D-mannosamine dehydrogenase n=1 Tax=Celeribacter sp. SCSIO 80788 TaxID=3117013 RepID=UPI003DA60FCA